MGIQIENVIMHGTTSPGGPDIRVFPDGSVRFRNAKVVPLSWYVSREKPIGDKEFALHTLFWLIIGLCLGVAIGSRLPGAWSTWSAWALWATLIPVGWLMQRAGRRKV